MPTKHPMDYPPFTTAAPPSAAASAERQMSEQNELPGMLAVAKGVAEQKWPHTVDAKVWAEEFYKMGWRVWKEPGGVEPDQVGLMLAWFANAIMAGYDTAQARAAASAEVRRRCDWVNAIVRHVAELPDRSSPDDQPEMMLVSADELREAINRIAPIFPHIPAASAEPKEPV